MFRLVIKCIFVAALLLPGAAIADPVVLKLAMFTSDRSSIYQVQVKPFVDAVNSEGKGLVEIKVYFSGAIAGTPSQQPKLVAEGAADIAFIVPGYTQDQFPDTTVLALPGLYRDDVEASHVFTYLAGIGALQGYKDYFTIGAFVSVGESLHSRKPINSLADLHGLVIRANNPIEVSALEKLGAIPTILAINRTTDALSQAKIDGAMSSPGMLSAFGIGRSTRYHYMLHLGGVPNALVMN